MRNSDGLRSRLAGGLPEGRHGRSRSYGRDVLPRWWVISGNYILFYIINYVHIILRPYLETEHWIKQNPLGFKVKFGYGPTLSTSKGSYCSKKKIIKFG